MTASTETSNPLKETFAYRILRYNSNLVRDEWLNIGVLLFDPLTGKRRLRLIESEEEFRRVRRLHPEADERLLRSLRDELEDRFAVAEQTMDSGGWQKLLEKWDTILSNAIQLAPQKGVHADDLDLEMERLYHDHVAPPRAGHRVGAPGSRAAVRDYCAQVWRNAGLWNVIEKSIRVATYTFAGDPMRFDYGYRTNGTRGFVQTLSVSRAPADAKLFAYTADRIAQKAAFKSEFTAVTDISLDSNDERHRFVRDTLRDARIVPVAMEEFATWVPRLKERL